MLPFTDELARTVRREPPGCMIPFALFWSGFIAIVCVVVITGAARQVASAYRPRADGTITVSEPNGRRGNFWKVEYVYAVHGREYTGAKYADDPMPIQGGEEVLRHVAVYPVGATVPVYYDADNPADAVIRPGLRGCTLWVALALTPFVLVGVLLWWFGLMRRRWMSAFDPTNRRQVAVTETGTVMVCPERARWCVTFLTYLAITAFFVSWVLGVFGAGLGMAYWLFEGFLLDPPLLAPTCVWAAVLIGCALATWRVARKAPLLIVDAVDGVLRFFAAGVPPVEVPFTAIATVLVFKQMHRQRKGNNVRHRVEVIRGDGGAALAVAEYDDPRDAAVLAAWLGPLLIPAKVSPDRN
jgi:hypothetical protein